MTGWRLGWLVAPEKFIEKIEHLAQISTFQILILPKMLLCLIQSDVVSQLDSNLVHYKEQKDYLMNELLRIDLKFLLNLKELSIFMRTLLILLMIRINFVGKY